jgi:hypothetical protein
VNQTAQESTMNNDSSQRSFKKYFSNIDTSKAGNSFGCSAGVYKFINSKYVVHLSCDLPVQFDSCYHVIADSSNTTYEIELLIFDNVDANLTNTCSDMHIDNMPKPTRVLNAKSGELLLGYSDSTKYYGNSTQRTTILIKKLIFKDDKTGEKIVIENELLWKVLNLGTPG